MEMFLVGILGLMFGFVLGYLSARALEGPSAEVLDNPAPMRTESGLLNADR